MVAGIVSDSLWQAQKPSLTRLEAISDKVGSHLWRAQKSSATTVETVSVSATTATEKVCLKNRPTPHQRAPNPSVYRPFRWWGVSSSPHQRPHHSPHQPSTPITCHPSPRWWGVWWDVWWGVPQTPHHPNPALTKAFQPFWWGVGVLFWTNRSYSCQRRNLDNIAACTVQRSLSALQADL